MLYLLIFAAGTFFGCAVMACVSASKMCSVEEECYKKFMAQMKWLEKRSL